MFALVYDKGSTGVYFSPRPNMWKSQRCPGSPWVLKLPTGGGVAGEIDCSVLEVFSVRSAVYFINTITEVCFFFHLPNWQSQPRQSQSAIKKTILTFFFPPAHRIDELLLLMVSVRLRRLLQQRAWLIRALYKTHYRYFRRDGVGEGGGGGAMKWA